MANYWLTKALPQAIGVGYALLVLVGLALALWLPKRYILKFATGAAVLAFAAIPVVRELEEGKKEQQSMKVVQERYMEAKALFDERCKSAGVRIFRRVSGVRRFHLLALRPDHRNFRDQYALDDPYGSDYPGVTYAFSMLWGRSSETGRLSNTSTSGAIYEAVTFPNIQDGKSMEMRLTGSKRSNGELEYAIAPAEQLPRYGVVFEDISTHEDRSHWLAGSRLRVVDQTTGEVLAERVGWMMDDGQGDTDGGRSPWLFAATNACPAFPIVNGNVRVQRGQTRNFVEQVLIEGEGKR